MKFNSIQIAVLLLCLLPTAPVLHAGVAEGVEAHKRGRFADARKELTTPAETGDEQAMAAMGEMLMRGQGGARDELKARDYITRAQAAGNLRATYLLANMFLAGNLVTKDEAKGMQLMREAAEKGESSAQTTFGVWLYNGSNGYAKDEVTALAWFKAAAEQSNAAAMASLGTFYERGAGGVAQDYLVALDWYKKSGVAGNTTGMTAAGRVYALGRGVTADGNEALRWLRRAAVANHFEAFQWIAGVYEVGRGGVARNSVLAYSWYAAIPANAQPAVVKSATEGKERLAKTLSATELAEAEKQSKTVVGANIAAVISAAISSGQAVSAPRRGVYGSGVVVSDAGDIITNEHVVNNCARVRIQPLGKEVKVITRDVRNDLALLRVEGAGLPAAKLRPARNMRLGDSIVVIGYPLKGLLSSGAVVTEGIVNALTGLKDDTSAFQISATVQPGSSGGPIFDRAGNLAGIVRARLLSTTQANAQNVNFGINLAIVGNFLDTHAVNYQTAAGNAKAQETADLVERARRSTVQVECY